MVSTRVARRLVCVVALSVVVLVIPAEKLNIASEAMRIHPQEFKSTISIPGSRLVGRTTWSVSSRVRIRFSFAIDERPPAYSDVFTTGPAASGLGVAVDQYANIYLRIGSVHGGEDSYSLMFLASTLAPRTWHTVDIEVDETTEKTSVTFDSERVRVNEARPGKSFALNPGQLVTSEIILGGTGPHVLIGEIRDFELTAISTANTIDGKSIRLLLVLVLVFLVTYWLAFSSRDDVS